MSSAHAGNPQVQKLLFYGVIILTLAFLYEYYGWDFLTRNYNLTKKEAVPVFQNDGGIPGDTFFIVTTVTDGDTLHVDMNGVDEKVRLLGINTPESVDPRRSVECYGKEASVRMKELAYKKSVRFETDATQSTRDAYGRILAYVYLEDGQMLNRKMIAEGYAYEYTYLEPYKYRSEFRSLQNLAKASKRGLWADDTCHGNNKVQN